MRTVLPAALIVLLFPHFSYACLRMKPRDPGIPLREFNDSIYNIIKLPIDALNLDYSSCGQCVKWIDVNRINEMLEDI